jgi:hypothetical protein
LCFYIDAFILPQLFPVFNGVAKVFKKIKTLPLPDENGLQVFVDRLTFHAI